MFFPAIGRVSDIPKPIRIWGLLVCWFCVCASIWALVFLDWEYGRFSLFSAARYLIGLLVLVMAAKVSITGERKRVVLRLLTASGVFVAAYCVPEFVFGTGQIVVKDGLVVNLGKGTLVGPFGASYFQLAQTSSLLAVAAFSLFSTSGSRFYRFIGPIVVAFVSWPLFFSGSRTGLGLFAISVAVLTIIDKRARMFALFSIVVLAALVLILDANSLYDLAANATTLYRLEAQGDANSVGQRLAIIFNFPLALILPTGYCL